MALFGGMEAASPYAALPVTLEQTCHAKDCRLPVLPLPLGAPGHSETIVSVEGGDWANKLPPFACPGALRLASPVTEELVCRF